ncbi:MAG: hypothetical protein HOW73_33560 [Polyangiaceae bacterium]|nr:hypothetical protein [Polyangiaceae bacterium]
MSVGSGGMRVGAGIGILLAAVLHGYMVVRVYSALWGIEAWIHSSRKEMSEFFLAFGPEVETARPEVKHEEQKPAPVQEKEQEPVEQEKQAVAQPVVHQQQPQQQQPQQQQRDPYSDDKVEAGGGQEARADLTQSGPLEPAGSGGGFGGGKGNGTGSGNGSGIQKSPPPPPPTPPAPTVDLSRPAELVGSKSWNCPFPPEADAEGKDSAVVQLVVTVSPDGSPENVKVMADPGSGFGRSARSCALGRRYKAGLDREGKASRKTTAPITVRFSR